MRSLKSLAILTLLGLSGCANLATKEATVACHAADAATTAIVLKQGAAGEGNPVMAAVIERAGLGGFFIAKAVLVWALVNFHEQISKPALGAVNAGTCLIAMSNARLLR